MKKSVHRNNKWLLYRRHLECELSTSEAIWHVDLQFDVTEQHGQGHWKVALCLQRDMPVASLQIVKGQNTLTQHFVILVVHADPQAS
jgi:hypothetical protein